MNVEAHIKTENPIPLKSRTIIHLSLVQNKINESISCLDVKAQVFIAFFIISFRIDHLADSIDIGMRYV